MSGRTEGAKPAFRSLFREYGIPEVIRTDNGAPFASTGIHGLCEVNVWWMKLGIVHQRIRPASPKQNGHHERMHKNLKREAAKPPAENLAKQQKRLNLFRQRYNHERPHEAFDGDFPAERWQPSTKAYTGRLRGEKTVHRAYAGIALPNPLSVKLHERLGYHLLGTFQEVGFKFDQYWDVSWYEKDTSD